MTAKPVKSHARAVVIGGGIAGCSTLYHLTRLGLCDAVLVERDELTSGSTWHAAAQVTQFGGNQTMVALKRHSINLYRELAADPDHPINYHITGGMRLAHTQDQVDTYKHYVGMAAGMGVEMEFIDAAEVGRRHALINPEGLLGAWWDPLDGDIDPAGITFALARKAQQAGAEVYRFNPVTGIDVSAGGEYIVHTKNGSITCEIVVNATGYRVNEVGAMLGVTHPVTSMEHMYFLTDPIETLEALDHRVPIIRDPGDDFYSRQEKHGLLVGVYEQACKPFGMDGIDPNFTQALCPSDLDRCLDNMERIFKRLPVLEETGIHTVINGPITYTIDGAPLIGPIPGLRNAYCAIGLRAGIGESGGHGKILAELIVEGESEWDAWFLDPRRFTQYANTEHTCLKAVEDYRNEFHYHLPHEQRPAARLARTTPLYSVLDQKNCAWGVVAGWERALFFKPTADFIDEPGYRFNATKEVVAGEVRALVNGVALMEVSGFNRFEISGAGAHEFLDQMICGRMPTRVGQVRLCYLLTEKGNILSEATIACIGDNCYWYGSAAVSQWHDRDWLQQHMPGEVTLRELVATHTTVVVAGPKSRELLQSVSPRGDWSAETFKWMQVHKRFIGHAEVVAMSVSFSGELAFELHVANEQLYLLWTLLEEAGKAFDATLFGLYATESMRMEKGYRHWKADIHYEFNPFESGLEQFVDMNKDFIGKAALQQAGAHRKRFIALNVDCPIAAAHTGDPVYCNGRQVGSVTSGAYGHRIEKNIAFAYVDPDVVGSAQVAEPGLSFSIGILGVSYPAGIVPLDQYDPGNQRVRA
ncbi:FAD-dependent oxidoreductase [Chromatiales bacterium (ex Bugula neritina AB1)]|nr:FAD-dependent oxidoreductase [Chromatiales bacterium (ex Bugula neritina AB1)]